jgi:serine/threonine protein kinase
MKIKEIQKKLNGKFKIKQQLGQGGNAIVFKAIDLESNSIVALKILISSDGPEFYEKKKRFEIETKKVLDICTKMSGIIPINKYFISGDIESISWYTMPIAIPIIEHFAENYNVAYIINCFIELSNTLEILHSYGIVHRDIKPSNLYFYNGNYCFADFGLIDYPEKDDLTRTGEQIGAKATIAPEMKQDSKHADGKAADVYSIAKTLWMMLTNSKYCFDGMYVNDSPSIGLHHWYPEDHLVELDKLLLECTSDIPQIRPNISDFTEKLKNYLHVYSSFDLSNTSEWSAVRETLFNGYEPENARWNNPDKIANVLNLLGKYPSLNHTFFPSGGGNDLTTVKLAAEQGCLEMHFDSSVAIAKPSELIMENIDDDPSWSYFRLELEQLQESGHSSVYNGKEYITEHIPGNYISWEYGNYGHYEDGTSLQKTARLVDRYLCGVFVIFSKSSLYNKIIGTYDARHNKMNSTEFRNYIIQMKHDFRTYGYKAAMEHYNQDPYRDPVDESAEETRIQLHIEDMQKWKTSAKKILTQGNFIDQMPINCSDGVGLQYCVILSWQGDICSKSLHLNKYGMFYEVDDHFYEDILIDDALFSDFTALKQFLETIDDIILVDTKLQDTSLLLRPYSYIIEIRRISAPSHLFTIDELRSALINGNDRKQNTLVVNGQGYLHLFESEDAFDLLQFPVINETYQPYGNYTGKYTSLFDLEEIYGALLNSWHEHLKHGCRCRVDYFSPVDNEKTIKEILEYYS